MRGLTILGVKNAKPGRHADGLGLYLLVNAHRAKSWVLRVQVDGRRRDIGLGSIADLSLTEAREKAAALRKVARAGMDPVRQRDKDRRAVPSFRAATIACHQEMEKGWTAKTAAGFLSSLETHAYPHLGKVQVDQIDASMIRDALASIWSDVPVMARKLRQRIGIVLSFAKSKGWRAADVPAAREITLGLARHAKGGNFAAMPHAEVPTFLRNLRSSPETIGRLALMFTILTAARSGETRNARWSHIDLQAKLWKRPAGLMKSREEHTVALSEEALMILKAASARRVDDKDCLIFEGKDRKPLSDMTLSGILRYAEITFTVHGFRSSFRDWAAEKMPTIPAEVAETALAHVVGNKTTRAYLRTDFMDMRFELARSWGDYCLN